MKKDTLETLLIRVPVAIFSFMYSIFLIRMLGPEGNGLYSFIMAGIGLSILVFGLDAKKSTLYHIVREEYNTEKVIGFTFKLGGLSTIIVVIILTVLYLLQNPVSFFFIPEEYFYLFYVLFFIGSFICQHFTELFSSIIMGHKAFRNYNLFMFFTSLLQVLFYGMGYLMVTRIGEERNFRLLFLFILGIQLLILLTSWILYRKTFKGRVNYKADAIRPSYLRYARLSYADQIGHFLNKRVDIWFIEVFSGLKSLGIYALASQMTNFLLLFAAPVEEVLKPYLIGMDRVEGNKVFTQYFRLIFYLISGMALGLFLVGPWLIPTFFGEDFSAAVVPLKILAVGVVFVNLKRMMINYNKAFNDLKINIWAQWSGVLVTVILDVILIPTYGINGAAWASLLAYIATALVLGIYLLKRQSISLSDLILLKSNDIRVLKALLNRLLMQK
ncbi:MAG: oligosaccharide flippase family protein [Saprospiraceae bacterium]|nr:oligosaccharide flippase family protein [Saprospiraceae bacterium]